MVVTTRKNLGRVLVADDDPVLCALCQATLWAEGWEVELAADGDEALEHIAASATPFDCVVSDVNMPGTGGLALLDQIHARDEILVQQERQHVIAMNALVRRRVDLDAVVEFEQALQPVAKPDQ